MHRRSVDGARWIIVTPSLADEAWRDAIRAAAHEAGLTVLPHGLAVSSDRLKDPDVLIYAQDPALALGSEALFITAIMPEPRMAVSAVSATYGTSFAESVLLASRVLAQAADLAPDHPVIGADQLRSSTGPLEVFPGFSIQPPAPVDEVALDETGHAIGEILGIYERGRPRIGDAPVLWAPEALSYDERAIRGADFVGEMDLTGRPRILVYGPYVALPPGLWRAVIRFSVDEAAAGRKFRIDWGSQVDYRSHVFTPGRPGVFEIELEYRWTTVAPAEVRLLVMEGCFSGAVVFMGARVDLIDGPTTNEMLFTDEVVGSDRPVAAG